MSLQTIITETAKKPKIVIIWMHGLGADGNDFAPIVPHFNIGGLPIKFIFPHAPKMPLTINGGMLMRAWYDILAMDIDRHIDEPGLSQSATLIHELIDEQIKLGFSHQQIQLAGFSQGAAMSLHISTQYPHKLAGVIALSGYLPLPNLISSNNKNTNLATPIFMGHGVHDPVVPFALGENSKNTLSQAGYKIDWHTYPIQHEVSMDELMDIKKWISNNITT